MRWHALRRALARAGARIFRVLSRSCERLRALEGARLRALRCAWARLRSLDRASFCAPALSCARTSACSHALASARARARARARSASPRLQVRARACTRACAPLRMLACACGQALMYTPSLPARTHACKSARPPHLQAHLPTRSPTHERAQPPTGPHARPSPPSPAGPLGRTRARVPTKLKLPASF